MIPGATWIRGGAHHGGIVAAGSEALRRLMKL